MHGSPEESILIDRQSTPQPKSGASPLLRQSSIGAKQVQLSSFPDFWYDGHIEYCLDIGYATLLPSHTFCGQLTESCVGCASMNDYMVERKGLPNHFNLVQGRMSRTCGRLTALVLLANAMVAMYIFLGSGKVGTSWAGFFAKSMHGSSGSSSGMGTTLWSRVDSSNFEPQVIIWSALPHAGCLMLKWPWKPVGWLHVTWGDHHLGITPSAKSLWGRSAQAPSCMWLLLTSQGMRCNMQSAQQ